MSQWTRGCQIPSRVMRNSNGKGIPIIPYPVGSGLGCRSPGVCRPRRSRALRCTAVHCVDVGVPKEMLQGKESRTAMRALLWNILLLRSSGSHVSSYLLLFGGLLLCVLCYNLWALWAAASLNQVGFFNVGVFLILLRLTRVYQLVSTCSPRSCSGVLHSSVAVETSNASRQASKPSALCHLLLFLTSSGSHLALYKHEASVFNACSRLGIWFDLIGFKIPPNVTLIVTILHKKVQTRRFAVVYSKK
jgi:hypothetical protein